jgi:hypothetical protein
VRTIWSIRPSEANDMGSDILIGEKATVYRAAGLAAV